MFYELMIENPTQIIIQSFPHTRKGLQTAFGLISKNRLTIVQATIISGRDGLIYTYKP